MNAMIAKRIAVARKKRRSNARLEAISLIAIVGCPPGVEWEARGKITRNSSELKHLPAKYAKGRERCFCTKKRRQHSQVGKARLRPLFLTTTSLVVRLSGGG